MPLIIEGIGYTGDCGKSLASLERRFATLFAEGALEIPQETASDRFLPVFPVETAMPPNFCPLPTDTSGLAAFLPAKALRQTDHFTRLALFGVFAALADAGLTPEHLGRTGIILTSGYGPIQRTFDFLDSLLEYGPELASPTAFSLSVHNIPAATLAIKLGVGHACSTVCQWEGAVTQGLITARSWLREGRVDRVLLGAVDERTPMLAALAGLSPAAKLPLPELPLGEASIFFCLSRNIEAAKHGSIHSLLSGKIPLLSTQDSSYASLFSGAPLPPLHQETIRFFLTGNIHDLPHARYAGAAIYAHPVYGSLPISMALDMALACAAVKGKIDGLPQQAQYPCVHRGTNGMFFAATISPATSLSQVE